MVALGWVLLAFVLVAFTELRYSVIDALNGADAWVLFVLLLFSLYWYQHS